MGVLLQCLASMTHHSSTILLHLKDYPGHPLLAIPILNEPKLLANLLPLVTTEPSDKIQAPTGIPPQVRLLSKLTDLLNLFQDKRKSQRGMHFSLCETVQSAIEDTALENANITHHFMSSILDEHQKN